MNTAQVQSKIKEIQTTYLTDSRPWVIGYSGGKDSTAVVQLVFEAIRQLPLEKRTKHIYILSSDTLIETPLIVTFIHKALEKIQIAAQIEQLPITVHLVQPSFDSSFWTLLIGRGYPNPRQKFRWCTDRLKIGPANTFIRNTISKHGEAILVLGVRRAESSSRANVIASHSIDGKVLKKHSNMSNAYVYAPIEDLTADDVWIYLLQHASPWGGDNNALLALYQDSKAGDCPLVVDQDTPSCGNSRFGCWVCTVVTEDKALIGFIESGHKQLIPLLRFRNWLQSIRDVSENREKRRTNGSVYFKASEGEEHLGFGPFTLAARQMILRQLLLAEQEYGQPLIHDEELIYIRQHWLDHGDWEDALPQIIEEIRKIPWTQEYQERPLLTSTELALLDTLCTDANIPSELVRRLVQIEFDQYGLKHRHNLFKEIDHLLKQDWLHLDIVERTR